MSGARIRLTPRNLSELILGQWLSEIEPELPLAVAKLRELSATCEQTRAKMDYNTGSIPFATAVMLYAAVRNVKPKAIFEIGTFIGKSALAMAFAADQNESETEIFTCDGSNDFHIPSVTRTKIVGFPKTTSTDALQRIAQSGKKIDFAHIDGRLAPQDFDLLESIADPRIIVALDDFEGIEKGIANFSTLRGRKFFGQHALVYPASDATLARIGLMMPSTTAFMIPIPALTYAPQ